MAQNTLAGVELVGGVVELVRDQREDVATEVVEGDYPNRWYSVDIYTRDPFTRRVHRQVRVLADDLESGSVAVIVFDRHGVETNRATFSNMPAGVISPVVQAYLA